MNEALAARVAEAKAAAQEVLRHNARGPFYQLPRTAGWGYPEPYTRDLMLATLGILASGEEALMQALRRTFEALAENQTGRGHIPSLAHDPCDVGASDTTPLFLLALALFRQVTGERDFLKQAARKAMTWMEYQSPGDQVIVGQLPTTDWRDEQWVLGFSVFVNSIVYAYLRLYGQEKRAALLRRWMSHFIVRGEAKPGHVVEGLVVPHRPYYALWSYKIYSGDRFDLLGNCFAILSGLASQQRAKAMVTWVENECEAMQKRYELAVNCPPCLFPYIRPLDFDWRPRYERFNRPGEYHNGGVWPFACGLYVVAALVAGFPRLAEEKLAVLTELVRPARDHAVTFGFNEWVKAQDGTPRGQDWQTWSAAMYLYAAACVEQGRALFFEPLLTHREREATRAEASCPGVAGSIR
jgi:hypothetical protein